MIPSTQWSGPGASAAARSDAPADNASNMHQSAPNPRSNLQSCQFCRKRKIKCDKLEGGCSQCARAQNECIYPASQRKGRPRKAGTNRPAPAPTPREAQLLKKIWKLERLVISLSGESAREGGDVSIGTMDHLNVDESSRTQLGRLVIGKPYLNDTFWSNHITPDVLEDSDEESNNEDDDENVLSTALASSLEVFPANFIFDVDQPANLKHFHPHQSQVQMYWRFYLENCEALIRIFHTPTTSKIVDQAQADVNGLSKSQELVMFAIYFATITSMSEEDVLTVLGGDRAVLLSQYQMAVQKAMVNAGFLNTRDLAVLQAFVLYLVSIRNNDGAAVWTMTGLAIRIAHGMGVDRDGELFNLKPLETELRRRAWHQISLLDLRASEASGAFPTHLSYDTKLPSNINDSDFGPETKSYPQPRVGLTDMTASLVRLEFCEVTRRLHKTSSMAAKEKMIEEFSRHLEATHLQYCVEARPLERWCAKLATLIMRRMILMLFKREKDLPQATTERLFSTSLEVIDLANQLRRDHYARRWEWLIRIHMQWHAMAVVLQELAEQPASNATERAWNIIDAIKWDEPEDRVGKILSQSIKRVLAKAQAHKLSQTSPAQADIAHPESLKSPITEPYFALGSAFDPALLGHNYHGPANFMNVDDHHSSPFYVEQRISPHHTGPQQPTVTWYFDSAAIEPLPEEQEPMVFSRESWRGWDMVRDDPMHRGYG